MYPGIQTSSQQLFAVVGSTFVSEHHSDEIHRYLPLPEAGDFVVNFDELLKALRAVLCLR